MIYSKNRAGNITIIDIDANKQSRIDSRILRINVDYTMGESSELSFDVIDFDGSMKNLNYFEIGRTVVYSTKSGSPFSPLEDSQQNSSNHINLVFEIANVQIGPGAGYSSLIQVKCYTKAIQQMKRDRDPGSITQTGTDFVKRAAKKYGLNLYAENTSKKQTINKASGDSQAESLWDVLSNLASSLKFELFEADGTLFFCSQKFLIGKWGIKTQIVEIPKKNRKPKGPTKKTENYIPIFFNPLDQARTPKEKVKDNYFEVLQRPSITISDNDPQYAAGSLSLNRKNGTLLRPGMTIQFFDFNKVDNVVNLKDTLQPTDDGLFLVESVSFEDLSPSAVQVTFKKPDKLPKDIKNIEPGKRYKFSTSKDGLGNLVTERLDKNGKVIRPKTVSEKTRINLNIKTGDMPINFFNDGLVNPLPTKGDRFKLPRYPSAIAINTSTSGSMALDMYSRPIADLGNGTISSLAPMIVENVIDPLVNGGLSFTAVIPRVLRSSSSSVPTYLSSAVSASTSFITSSLTSSNPLFLAKLPDFQSASRYMRLCNLQQSLVVGKRFGNITPPESNTYPIPTSASPSLYPYMGSGLIEKGNIDLYNRPVLVDNQGVKTTNSLTIYPYQEPNSNVTKSIGSMVITSGFATLTIPNTNTNLFTVEASVMIRNEFQSRTNSASIIFPSTWPTSTSSIAFSSIEGVRQIASVTNSAGTTVIGMSINTIPTLTSSSITVTIPHASIAPIRNNGSRYALLLTPIWSTGGQVKELTEQQALEKYYSDGYFLGRCSSIDDAANYGVLISEQQSSILSSRFPDGNIVTTP